MTYQLNEKGMITQDAVRKITGRAALEFTVNPAFISFKNLSIAAANASIRKLIEAGYKATRFENYIKVTG